MKGSITDSVIKARMRVTNAAIQVVDGKEPRSTLVAAVNALNAAIAKKNRDNGETNYN